MYDGFSLNFKPLEILNELQLGRIHKATLAVLRETGIRFESKKALKLFEKNGCKVDYDNMRVKFPEALVEECIKSCPSSFRVKTRNKNHDFIIGLNTIHFFSFPGMEIVDLDTWESRKATEKEYIDFITVLDALDNHHMITAYPYFGFEGIPEVMAIPEGIAMKFKHTDKFQLVANQKECEPFTIEMAQICNAEVMGIFCASPPLTYYEDTIEGANRYINAGFPLGVVSGCVHAATGPATIAGSIVTDNAELLAGIVYTQLLKPGTRVMTNNFTFSQNMATGSLNFGGIESSLHFVASNQLARKYQIPKWSGTSGLTNSKRIDVQCGYEKGMATLIAALAGSALIQLHGGLFGEMTAHPAQAVLDDDIAGRTGQFIEGIQLTDETIALDVIEKVGPIPGCFIDSAHTRKWWRSEQFIPKASDRLSYPDQWVLQGKKSALDYAKEKVEEILTSHKIEVSLTPSQVEDIDRILEEARKFYKEKKLL